MSTFGRPKVNLWGHQSRPFGCYLLLLWLLLVVVDPAAGLWSVWGALGSSASLAEKLCKSKAKGEGEKRERETERER